MVFVWTLESVIQAIALGVLALFVAMWGALICFDKLIKWWCKP